MKRVLFILMIYSVGLYPSELKEQYVLSGQVDFPIGEPTSIALSPDGKLGVLMQGAFPQSDIFAWDTDTGLYLKKLEVGDDDVFINTLQFTRAGKIFYAGYASEDGIGIVKFATDSWQRTKDLINVPVNEFVSYILFYSPVKALAFVDSSVYLWKQEEGNQQYYKIGHMPPLYDLYGAFNHSGDRCVVGHLNEYPNDLLIINTHDMSVMRKLTALSLIANLIWSPDGTKIAAATTTAETSQNLNILLWDLNRQTNDPVSIPSTLNDFPTTAMTFSPDSNLIFFGNFVPHTSPFVYDIKNNKYLSLLNQVEYGSIEGSSLPIYGLVATDFIDDEGTFKVTCGIVKHGNPPQPHQGEAGHKRVFSVTGAQKERMQQLKIALNQRLLKRLKPVKVDKSAELLTSVMTIKSQASQVHHFKPNDWVMIDKE